MKNQKLKAWSALVVVAILFLSFSQGGPEGRTGAPDEASCADAPCHGNSPDIDGNIEFSGFPSALVSDQKVEIEISLVTTSGNPARGGMTAAILGEVDGQLVDIGELSNAGSDVVINFVANRNRTYLAHSPAKDFGSGDRVTYTADWTTPTSFNTDSVTIYASAVFANGNGGRTGDQVILNSLVIPVTNQIDADGDGFDSDIDCNDNDAAINPDAEEIVNNDVDENCDGVLGEIDEDNDGFNSDEDCDDNDFNISPAELEIPNNDVDENCDGEILIIDEDNDGFNSDDDCDDSNPDINPDAVEIANNDIDENCDGVIEEIDEDNDGFNSDEDCDDSNPDINPDATEIPGNDVDENCDGINATDEVAFQGVIVDFKNEPLTNVMILDASTQNVLGSTNDLGVFDIIIPGTTSMIAFSREDSFASGLSSIDLILARNHILGNNPFQNELQILSSDVNGDNSVSAVDLVLMRRIILQLTFEVTRPAWNFVPSNLEATSTLPDTIRAFKLGDVNGSVSN